MANKKSRNEEFVAEEQPIMEEAVVEEVVEEAPKKAKAKIDLGDIVKINPNVSNDMLGRRIHNGIKNYNYVVKLIRPDGYLVLECLAYSFIVNEKEVTKL